MAHTTKVTLGDAMYDAAVKQAGKEGRRSGNDPGVASLIRKSLRYYLNQQRFHADVLDMNDNEYREHLNAELQAASERAENAEKE